MPLELSVQFDILIYSLLAGLIIGVFFDIYRIFRGKKGPKAITIIEDILFWILCALSTFTFLLYTNYAFLGAYVYLFMGVALILYLKLISPVILKIEMTIITTLNTIIRRGYKNITYPFRILWAKLGNKN